VQILQVLGFHHADLQFVSKISLVHCQLCILAMHKALLTWMIYTAGSSPQKWQMSLLKETAKSSLRLLAGFSWFSRMDLDGFLSLH